MLEEQEYNLRRARLVAQSANDYEAVEAIDYELAVLQDRRYLSQQ